MGREIRYCTTEDGVRIAYCVEGEGVPVVWLAEPQSSHLQLEMSQPWAGPIYSRLASRCQVIRHDSRGLGLSDRNVPDISLSARVSDGEAVVKALRLERFVLVGSGLSSPLAIAFAASNPELVSHLVLVDCIVRTADVFGTAQIQAVAGLLDQDWEMFTENVGTVIMGWGRDEARNHGSFMRATTTPDQVRGYIAALAADDASDMLEHLRMPVLVVHHSALPFISLDRIRDVVSAIPDARLMAMDGRYFDNWEQWIEFLAEFIGARGSSSRRSDGAVSLRTVLFTDLVGHTEMMSRLGDERGRSVLREHETITREVLKAHGGTEVKTMGDGFMASFGSVTRAVECAVALQKAIAERNAPTPPVGAQPSDPTSPSTPGLSGHSAPGSGDPARAAPSHAASSPSTPPEPLHVRVGLNAGEPIEEDGDLFGATVILASRIAAKADGGEILVADTVRGLCSGKGFLFSDRGEFVAKGFEEPVRVYEVNWRE